MNMVHIQLRRLDVSVFATTRECAGTVSLKGAVADVAQCHKLTSCFKLVLRGVLVPAGFEPCGLSMLTSRHRGATDTSRVDDHGRSTCRKRIVHMQLMLSAHLCSTASTKANTKMQGLARQSHSRCKPYTTTHGIHEKSLGSRVAGTVVWLCMHWCQSTGA